MPGCIPSDETPQKCHVITGGPVGGFDARGIRPATYYFHADHLGSTSWVTDARGLVHEHVEYYPYGEVWREPRSDDDKGPSTRTPYLFTSKEFDSETGLTYFGARYYDATKGRWISPDPSWMTQGAVGLNLYHYAHWSPVRYSDPDGRGWSDFLAGLASGTADALRPPVLLPATEIQNAPPDFYLGRSLGRLATGTTEIVGGVSMMIGGTAMIGGGGVASGTGIGATLGIPVAAIGAAVAVSGSAISANGLHNVVSSVGDLKDEIVGGTSPATDGAGPPPAPEKGGVPGRVQSRINVKEEAFEHVLEEHFDATKASKKSQFSISPAKLRSLLSSTETIRSPARALRSSGAFARTITLEGDVGSLSASRGGGTTKTFTVLTDEFGNLTSAFPGTTQ